jgi:hypothetical protein
MKRTFAVLTIILVALLPIAGCTPPAQEPVAGMTERGKLLCAHQEGNCVEAWNGTSIMVYSDEGATATFQVAGDTGDVTMGGTTPVLTIGDAGAEDAGLVIDGAAQDFHFLLDDNVDDLVIGVGSAAGTTPAITVDENQNIAFGIAATGVDVYFYSDTSGDHTWYDASDEVLEVIGTDTATALNVSDGNVVIADTLDVNGTVDFDGTTFAVDSSGGFSIDDSAAASNVSVAGAGIDLTLSSAAGRVVVQGGEAAADAVYIDADGAAGNGLDIDVGSTGGMNVDGGCLNIGGGSPASCGDNDAYVTGDFEVDAALDVDGTIDFDGTTFDVLSSGGFSIDDSATSSNVSVAGAGVDLTLSSAAGQVVIQASEAAGNAVYIDADADPASGLDIDVGATTGVTIDGGMLNVGGGSYDTADADNDVGIAGDLEVDGELELDGALDADSTANIAGATTFGADVTLSTDATGGNALAKNEYIGLPRIMNVGISTMANGTTNTHITDMADSETPATDWTAVDADTTMSNDSTYYRQGTASLKMAVLVTADDEDGCTNTLASGDQDWTGEDSVGFWFYASQAITTGDINFVINDDGVESELATPEYATANVWQWMEVDISGVATASKDVVQAVGFELSAAGAATAVAGAFDVYFDFVVVWDTAEEESLGQAIPYDGVLSLSVIDATSGAATLLNIVEYTDYFVHYQTGSDAVVMISDQSDADKLGLALIAY